MKITCTTINSMGGSSAYNDIALSEFEPNIGAPFRVILINSVRQRVSKEGAVLETCIPNMGGLLREVALARSLNSRKFSPDEVKFIRKAIGLKGTELSELLGVSPEHLSRCENGDRTLSVAAEKLLRVIVLKKRYNYNSISEKILSFLDNSSSDDGKIKKAKDLLEEFNVCIKDLERSVFDSKIDPVYDANDELSFHFSLKHPVGVSANSDHDQDEEEWKRAA